MPASRPWSILLVGAALAAAPVCGFAANPAKVRKIPTVYTVTIQQMRFAPVPATLHRGDAIEWVNNDIFVHSATALDKSFDIELKPKAHVRMVLTKAGSFPFICRYHPGMTGRLVVDDPSAGSVHH